jgi:hypothetical protein
VCELRAIVMTWFPERNPWFAGRNVLTERQFRHPSRETPPRAAVPRPRLRSVGTKVSDSLYSRIVEAAGPLRISEWLRHVVTAATSEPSPTVLLAEVLALRTIVLTVQFALGAGETLTPDVMQRLIDRADAEKLRKAQERVTQGSMRTSP